MKTLHTKAKTVCGLLCRAERAFPFRPARPGEKKVLHRKWALVLGACFAFGVAIYIVGHTFTAGVVFGRVIEAIGDVLLDRGLPQAG
jgi:hypothetical protein